MRRCFAPQLLGALLLVCGVAGDATNTKFELLDYNGVAQTSSVVITSDGLARFTVLTPHIIRMEYSKGGFFEDRPSLAVVNRNLPTPAFTHDESSGELAIATANLTLKYKIGKPFSADSLTIVSDSFSWNAGMSSASDPGNLLGTFRTLDGAVNFNLNCSQQSTDHCEFGLISRSGWSVINDSVTPVLDSNDWWTDDNGHLYQRKSDVDLYFLGHGLNYKLALQEYSLIGGRIPLAPRYASGVWYTRWYNYNAEDAVNEAQQFVSRGIPLDVWVFDMNWHRKEGWTGYTLDDALFPVASEAFDYFGHFGIKVAGNIHDADGVGPFEKQNAALAKALGLQPGNSIPFTCANRTFMVALEDVVMQPLEEAGFDFWWLDWQQGESGFGTLGGKMNPTIWTNKLRATDKKRRNIENNGGSPSDVIERGFLYGRFGGLGNHRYQVGFSGDVSGLTWSNLAYQPYFSSSAANVLFAYWSHDIVGPGDDPEMYVRWIQWAVFSGVVRLHDRGMSHGGCYKFPTVEGDCPIVEPWNVPRKYMQANRAALRLREQLIPYIYTNNRIAFDSGVSLLRPLYYDYPEDDMAYAGDRNGNFVEYMFGEDMLVAPVVSASGPTTMTNVTYYLPQGTWIEWHTGSVISLPNKGSVISRNFALEEIPVYVRAGAVIPLLPCCDNLIANAAKPYDSLIFTIFQHESVSSGEGRVYEDDGISTGYLQNQFAWTTLSYQRTAVDNKTVSMTFTLETEGTFDRLPTQRSVVLRIVNAGNALQVSVNNRELSHARKSRFPKDTAYWSYDGIEMTLEIEAGTLPVGTRQTISVLFSDNIPAGARGAVSHAAMAKASLDETGVTPGSITGKQSGSEVSRLAMYGSMLAYSAGDATAFGQIAANVSTALSAAQAELNTLTATNNNNKPSRLVFATHSTQPPVLCPEHACPAGYNTTITEGYTTSPLHPLSTTLPNTNIAVISPERRVQASNAGEIVAVSAFAHETAQNQSPVFAATAASKLWLSRHGYRMVDETVGFIFTEPHIPLAFVQDTDERVEYTKLLLVEAARWLQNGKHSAEPVASQNRRGLVRNVLLPQTE